MLCSFVRGDGNIVPGPSSLRSPGPAESPGAVHRHHQRLELRRRRALGPALDSPRAVAADVVEKLRDPLGSAVLVNDPDDPLSRLDRVHTVSVRRGDRNTLPPFLGTGEP